MLLFIAKKELSEIDVLYILDTYRGRCWSRLSSDSVHSGSLVHCAAVFLCSTTGKNRYSCCCCIVERICKK